MLNIKENESLKNHTTFHIGGPAKYFVIVKTVDEVKEAIEWAQEKKIDYRVIGGGSNILVSDNGYDGLVIKYFGGDIRIDGDEMAVGAGTALVQAMNESLKVGLSGLEWAIGIPGTIGGAVCNNAGAYCGEMSQSVIGIKALMEGKIIELKREDCEFAYRSSAFKAGKIKAVILSVKLKLKKVSEDQIKEINMELADNLADRNSKSAEGGSAGSTFRNIILSEQEMMEFKKKHPEFPDRFVAYNKIPAAWLIEECGLKGKKIGGAMVSERHAGKITNIGGATAENVIMLISVVKQKVRSKFSQQLMEEVEYLGF